MSDLVDVYKSMFKGRSDACVVQDQGTCGLISFWYAVQLMTKGQTAIPFPRKRTMYQNGSPAVKNGASLREYVKKNLQSAQGEILSASEMAALVKAFGFESDVSTSAGQGDKETFVGIELGFNRPVLFAYTWDDDKNVPVPTGPIGGAHWSLIIGVDGGDYRVVEPNTGADLKRWKKQDVLDANANVGKYPLPQFWMKTTKRSGQDGPDLDEFKPNVPHVKKYDIYPTGRTHELGNVLVAVRT